MPVFPKWESVWNGNAAVTLPVRSNRSAAAKLSE